MMLQRCAWHRFPQFAILRVAVWHPVWRIEFSDGLCSRCAQKFLSRAELGRGRRELQEVRAA
jgi:hypothetical protein